MTGISIKQIRKAHHLTQKELADKLGVVQSAISMWETGTTEPRLDKLKQMAVMFECTVDDLLKDEDSE